MFYILIVFSIISWQSGGWNVDKKGVAIAGYDPVSYFQGKPAEGDPNFSTRYQGAIFYFANGQNLNVFKSDPQKYAPQYGGYCAYAMGATGEKVEINPETWKITDGRLFLFYNSWRNNTLVPWNENEKALKEQADKNWEKISLKKQ